MSKICPYCNAENNDASNYCRKCGRSIPPANKTSAAYTNVASATTTYVPVQPSASTIPEEYKPISMWGYFGYELLFAIPLVGFILLLVFSFGGARNVNLKNFARSYFCILIIAIILAVLVMLMGGSFVNW